MAACQGDLVLRVFFFRGGLQNPPLFVLVGELLSKARIGLIGPALHDDVNVDADIRLLFGGLGDAWADWNDARAASYFFWAISSCPFLTPAA